MWFSLIDHSNFCNLLEFCDADWLEKILSEKGDKPVPKLVTVVNPGNPSGVFVPKPLLQVSCSTHPYMLILILCLSTHTNF